MKKYLVIGNPIEHSKSPLIHNYWMKKNNINAHYDKKLLKENEIESLIQDFRKDKINGVNVTVPFKKCIIPFLDKLSHEATTTQSVNTIYKIENKIIGDNTDIEGFQISLEKTNHIIKNKIVFILGAGGVVPSIIVALEKMGVSKIYVSNRTELKTLEIKDMFPKIEIIKWGETIDFDIMINATSIGLHKNEEIILDYEKTSKNKFFYDVIYNPKQTNFLIKAKKFGAKIENGKMMFLYQAQKAFFLWHGIMPQVDSETIKLMDR
tara:strand:- start:3191 stop:3985 length:795 start_codon:yes stop_codon:yes gene_type:complete